MEAKTLDRQKLTAYLLGALPESEQETIAEEYFRNDELFELLLEVESDLIRQYVRGDLPTEKRLLFENHLRSLPEGREKIALARMLAEISPEERAAANAMLFEEPAPGQHPAQTTSLRQTLTAWLAQPVFILITAIGLVMLGGVIWLILYSRQLSHDRQQLLAQFEERDARHTEALREAERRLDEEQSRSAQLQQDLDRERLRREGHPNVQSPIVSLPMSSWLLSPTAVRDPGQPSETVRRDPKAKTIALLIPDDGKRKYTGYEVELRTEDGKQILWKDSQPYPPPIRRGQNIIFYRPAREFTSASYKLSLTLVSDQETKTRDYYFIVAN